MGKALIIAEKPSVAGDIAKALGGFKKHDDHFESDQYVLTSAVGHLLEIFAPEDEEIKRGKWTFTNLPVIPRQFRLRPIEKSASRLKAVAKLLARKDLDGVINACDAGREGELIFRYLIQYAKSDRPIQRLWLQSMTPASIREGFQKLRTDGSMLPLADAAVCRSESDWLVGINGTRAMTAFNNKTGGFQLTTVGRVQTPTLAILVEREAKIRIFVPKDYWEVHATFGAQAGDYAGRWFDEKFQKPKEGENGGDQRAERIWDVKLAEAIREKCQGKVGIVTEESKPTTQLSPLLYDLTSLQREANGRFGFSAKQTLSIAQTLYEKHKALTYPRTDSRHLPEDYQGTVRSTLKELTESSYGTFASQILSQQWVRPNKRVFNNARVSDHFAIIPTTLLPKQLTEAEHKIYDMVTKRFLAVFYPAAEFLVTTRITRVEGEPFKSEGKVMVNPGWLAIYGKEVEDTDTPSLTPVQPGEKVRTLHVDVAANQTKPPARFSEATLLTAMEGAGKLIEDEELREAMSAKGLGTPATRASIIEGLIYEKYVQRLGRELKPTAKAFSVIALLRGLGIPELCSPELTGNWEFKLKQMERGELKREEFMSQIAAMTRDIVEKAKGYQGDTVPGDFGVLKVRCPKCREGEMRETYRQFQCQSSGCGLSIWKTVASRQIEAPEIEELIAKGAVGPLEGFRSKMGRPFSGGLRLTPEFKIEFDFGPDAAKNGNGVSAEEFAGKEPLGKCPKCGAAVFEGNLSYICEKAVGEKDKKTCDFRSGKMILQQPVDQTQMRKLLETGKTDLLPKFISKKGRPFGAYLVVSKGKVGFEFEPRKPGAKGSKAAKEPQPKVDFTGQESLGKCPKCGAPVFETETHYVCEKTQADSRPCKFRSGKVICEQPIERDQVKKMLENGRTDVLSKFISKRGKPFKAQLAIEPTTSKVVFEFADDAAS